MHRDNERRFKDIKKTELDCEWLKTKLHSNRTLLMS